MHSVLRLVSTEEENQKWYSELTPRTREFPSRSSIPFAQARPGSTPRGAGGPPGRRGALFGAGFAEITSSLTFFCFFPGDFRTGGRRRKGITTSKVRLLGLSVFRVVCCGEAERICAGILGSVFWVWLCTCAVALNAVLVCVQTGE